MIKRCVFCQIAQKEIPAWIVFENKQVICFFPKVMNAYGHTLIAPKKHFQDIYDIPETLLNEIAAVIKKISLDYKLKIHATGMNLLHASGKDGQQSVFHFHVHLLPRFNDDKLNAWPNLPKPDIDRDNLLKILLDYNI